MDYDLGYVSPPTSMLSLSLTFLLIAMERFLKKMILPNADRRISAADALRDPVFYPSYSGMFARDLHSFSSAAMLILPIFTDSANISSDLFREKSDTSLFTPVKSTLQTKANLANSPSILSPKTKLATIQIQADVKGEPLLFLVSSLVSYLGSIQPPSPRSIPAFLSRYPRPSSLYRNRRTRKHTLQPLGEQIPRQILWISNHCLSLVLSPRCALRRRTRRIWLHRNATGPPTHGPRAT